MLGYQPVGDKMVGGKTLGGKMLPTRFPHLVDCMLLLSPMVNFF